MNLANNLRKIRKENNLSQEQLAEKLGVSRQSVSKWESEQAYPEMDKMIQICDIFDITMDELLNQNVSQVNERKEEKATLAKYIDSFLAYVTKTIDLFSSMKMGQRIKCIIEQCVFGAIIAFAFFILGSLLRSILKVFFNRVPMVMDFFAAVYVAACVILGFALLFQIFKIRYLNYYEAAKKPKRAEREETEPRQAENNAVNEAAAEAANEPINEPINEPVNEEPVRARGKKQEKIIIRDPDHSEYKFISGLVKCFLMIIKIFAWTFGIGVCCTLIAAVCLTVMSFMILKSGLLFVGVFLILLATCAILSIILMADYCFLFNRKHHRVRFAVAFLCSVVIIGAGLGLSFVGTTEFNTPELNNPQYADIYVSDTIEGLPADKTIIPDYSERGYVMEYVPVESDTVKIEITHPNYMKCEPKDVTVNHDQGYVIIPRVSNENFGMKEIRNVIKVINRRIVPTYDNNLVKVTVYTSQQNLDERSNLNTQIRITEDGDILDPIEETTTRFSMETTTEIPTEKATDVAVSTTAPAA